MRKLLYLTVVSLLCVVFPAFSCGDSSQEITITNESQRPVHVTLAYGGYYSVDELPLVGTQYSNVELAATNLQPGETQRDFVWMQHSQSVRSNPIMFGIIEPDTNILLKWISISYADLERSDFQFTVQE